MISISGDKRISPGLLGNYPRRLLFNLYLAKVYAVSECDQSNSCTPKAKRCHEADVKYLRKNTLGIPEQQIRVYRRLYFYL